MVKIWDYQTKACVQTLDGHTHNVAAVCFHPELPLIVTGSEDGTIKLWHATTYRLENTLDYRMERVWGIGYLKGSNSIAVGYDEGTVMVKIGREEPVASMDSSGKIIWAHHNEIQTVNIKALGADFEMSDGERLPLATKDLGSSDLYPQSLQHNPNGRFVTVCGDGEYVVYTALAWRNKSFGQGLEFVWSTDSNEFAIRESASRVKLYKNFQEKTVLNLDFKAEGIYGGALVGVKSADFIIFYNWELPMLYLAPWLQGRLIRRVDTSAKGVFWSDSGEHVAVVGDESFYLLKFNAEAAAAALASGDTSDPDGHDEAFDLIAEASCEAIGTGWLPARAAAEGLMVSERVKTAVWVGDCFIFNNAAWRLNYCVGGEVTTLYHLDRPMYILGYLASLNRIFLIDKEFGVVSYTLLVAMIEFKTLAMRGDISGALALLPQLPKDALNGVARFLEGKGAVREALEVATDPEYRFDLAMQLGDLEVASEIATAVDSEPKWRQLAELAMTAGQLDVARQCLTRAKDFSGTLLMQSALGDRPGLQVLASQAAEAGKHNVAFLAHFLCGDVQACVDLLIATNRLPEAAFFCRTYLPSRMPPVVAAWKADLAKQNAKAAESLADPSEYGNLFPDLEVAIAAEALAAKQHKKLATLPASAFTQFEGCTLIDLIAKVKEMPAEDLTLGNGVPGGHSEAEEEQEEGEDNTAALAEEEEDEEEHTAASPTGTPAAALVAQGSP
ncbi:hypothetical protein QJQ45_029931, partial [Haematococcus lacustris]